MNIYLIRHGQKKGNHLNHESLISRFSGLIPICIQPYNKLRCKIGLMNQGSLKYVSCFLFYYSIESNLVLVKRGVFISEHPLRIVA
jgi:hypothetical protein